MIKNQNQANMAGEKQESTLKDLKQTNTFQTK